MLENKITHVLVIHNTTVYIVRLGLMMEFSHIAAHVLQMITAHNIVTPKTYDITRIVNLHHLQFIMEALICQVYTIVVLVY